MLIDVLLAFSNDLDYDYDPDHDCILWPWQEGSKAFWVFFLRLTQGISWGVQSLRQHLQAPSIFKEAEHEQILVWYENTGGSVKVYLILEPG